MSSETTRAPTIGFLHTSQVHVPTFDRLVSEVEGGFKSVSVVDEQLLDQARRVGPSHRDVVERISSALDELERAGVSTIVCTCSTIGGQAEGLGEQRSTPVVRVDRAMAEVAIATGTRVAIIGALESTFDPTRQLIESVASIQGAAVEISEVLCRGAWDMFEAGDLDGYMQAVATTCDSLDGTCDVIVLAQASMAGAAHLVEGSTPILSSPSLAVEAAAQSLRNQFDHGSDR